MTSDTKIGLLLGLIFIFVVAFVINGLPSFDGSQQSPNELSYNLAQDQFASPDLGAREENARLYIENSPYALLHTEVRDLRALPLVDPTVQDQAASILKKIQQSQMNGMNPNLLQKQQSQKVTAWPKVCEVRKNDNLGRIASRYYGSQEGNKLANITKIFKANRDILKSPNAVKVGQQLIIPALTPAASKAIEQITRPVKSMGNPAPLPAAVSRPVARYYTVKDDDSLWKIASSELGNGGRYPEIAKLNAALVSDENSVKAGMRLKLPTR